MNPSGPTFTESREYPSLLLYTVVSADAPDDKYCSPEALEPHRPVVVAVHQQKQLVELVPCVQQPPRGQVLRRGHRIADANAKPPPVSEVILDDGCKISEEEQHFAEPLVADHLDEVLEERAPMDLHHRLRPAVGERAKPRATATSQNDGLFGTIRHDRVCAGAQERVAGLDTDATSVLVDTGPAARHAARRWQMT